MLSHKQTGFIYQTKDGKFVKRFISSGGFQKTCFLLRTVGSIADATVFENFIGSDKTELEYNALLLEDFVNSCNLLYVEKTTGYMAEPEIEIIDMVEAGNV